MEAIRLHYNFQAFLSSQLVPWFTVETESNEAGRASVKQNGEIVRIDQSEPN